MGLKIKRDLKDSLKYNYYTDNKNLVVCTTVYQGIKFRSTAKCHPDDQFDYAVGKEIAKARVIQKITLYKMRDLKKRIRSVMSEIHNLNKIKDNLEFKSYDYFAQFSEMDRLLKELKK